MAVGKINIGIDLVHIPEIERIIEKRPRFKERVFSEREIRYCDSKARPAVHFAARFAAKEAFVKAAGYRGSYKDIEVCLSPGGAPFLEVAGGKGRGASLSLTHTGEYAAAVALAEGLKANVECRILNVEFRFSLRNSRFYIHHSYFIQKRTPSGERGFPRR